MPIQQEKKRPSMKDGWQRLSPTERCCEAFVIGATVIVGVVGVIVGGAVAGLVFAGAAFLGTALPLAGTAAFLESRRR